MDWAESLTKLIPLLGVPGAIFALMWYLERRTHHETRDEVRRCNEARISEAMAMVKVIEAMNAASAARDRSQEELRGALSIQASSFNQLVYAGIRR